MACICLWLNLIRGLPQWFLYRQALSDPKERLRFTLLASQSLNLPIVVGDLEGGSLLPVLVLTVMALSLKSSSES